MASLLNAHALAHMSYKFRNNNFHACTKITKVNKVKFVLDTGIKVIMFTEMR